MVSNADVAFIRKLYGHYRIEEIEAPRSISAVAKGRGNARELLVMNYG